LAFNNGKQYLKAPIPVTEENRRNMPTYFCGI